MDNNFVEQEEQEQVDTHTSEEQLLEEVDARLLEETPSAGAIAVEEYSDNDGESANLDPETRVGLALYIVSINTGIMTEAGVLLPQSLNMTQIAKQAEVSVNFAIKALGNIRKQGIIKNRREDGRLLIKLNALEDTLRESGAAIDEDY